MWIFDLFNAIWGALSDTKDPRPRFEGPGITTDG